MRIIAGKARGRKLIPPATMETRPTLDRVKEAMFSTIQNYLLEPSISVAKDLDTARLTSICQTNILPTSTDRDVQCVVPNPNLFLC